MNQDFESERLQLQQANQWADEAQRGEISLYREMEMRNRLFRELQATDCQEIEESRRIYCGPQCQRPGDKSSANALVSIQREQDKGVPHIPMHLRTRQRDTLDPKVQQHFEWLSFNWKTYFSSSSSSTWTESPTWWSSASLGPSKARMVLPRMARQRMAGSAISPTKLESRTDKYKGTCIETSEREGLNCCQVHLNPDSIRSLAHFSVWQFRVQTVATAMNATEGCTDLISPYAHTRTFSRCARLRTPDVITRFGSNTLRFLCVCPKVISPQVTSLLTVLSSPFLFFLITYCLTDTTYCFIDATDWNQIKPLCNSARR